MVTASIASFILALPLFLLISYENSLTNVSIVLIAFCLFSAASVGPSVSFLPTLFPVQNRYSSMALAVGLGEAFGGTTPLICHGFVAAIETPVAPAFYLMICSAFAWMAIKYSTPLKAVCEAENPQEVRSVYTKNKILRNAG